MTKIVYNACCGGFSLSAQAILRYAEKAGLTLRWNAGDTFGGHWETSEDEFFADREIPRTDANLVAVVEELGEAANGPFANLTIRELPEGTHYVIREYDGFETVMTREEFDWSVA